jgi:DNA repair protein RecN (Recombination protein N)
VGRQKFALHPSDHRLPTTEYRDILRTISSDIPVLIELRVENYAVIDHVAVEFAAGLNLLTGETGAGKSILIDALALLLGDKASSDVIRHGADKAVVSAVFEVEDSSLSKMAGIGHAIQRVLEENGIDASDGEIIVRREIQANGRGRVFVNNQPATVAVLKQLAPFLASVHAQNESILGFDAAARLDLLDAYAGVDTAPVTEAFSAWKKLAQHIAELEQGEQDRLRMVDLWSFQRKEIESARLVAGEDEKLESEKRVLANAEKIYSAAMSAYDLLYEGEASAASSLRAASRQLEELARYDEHWRERAAELESARLAAEDVGVSLREYAAGVNASPERLAEIEERLAALDRLKRKYGQTLDEVIAFGEEAARKLNEIENKDDVLRKLRSGLAAAGARYLAAARAVSSQRATAAKKLEKTVEAEINDLAMKAKFRIEIDGTDSEGNWTASGFDSVRYMIATNPGEPLAPVEDIASGGELSRVMLALKATVEGSKSPTLAKPARAGHPRRTLVFDEIDTGIGGRAAEAVGKKLKALSGTSQVICITHLPQIASFADQHYVIEKREAAGRTKTSVRRLDAAERNEELARMMSGAKVSEASLKHAEAMLKGVGRSS